MFLEGLASGGAGNAPGPSGKNWLILATAVQNEAADCDDDTAKLCYGGGTTVMASPGASLVLFDADTNDVIALSDVLAIPPTVDNDGDGLRDEDPEDGIDNDGDGLVDEDGACEDAIVINFTYEFPIDGLGIDPGDNLRADLIVPFTNAGGRGGSGASCTLDVDCSGGIDPDEDSNNKQEGGGVRSIQQRLGFDAPACTDVCQTVTLSDAGAAANDASCVAVINDQVPIVGFPISALFEGTEHGFIIDGTVTCVGGDCSTTVANTATLSCQDDPSLISLISGSPASAGFDVTCSDVGGGSGGIEIEPGDFCTQTQGGWGSTPRGNNTGALLHANFAAVFPSGLVVGDPDGPDADASFAILLTSAPAITDYLPAGGTPAALTADLTDPVVTSSGVFGGQLVAATLNVAFDAAGIGKAGPSGAFSPGTLGTLVYVAGSVEAPLEGLSVNDVLALANVAISGGGTPAGVTISDLSDALATLNENFVDCDTNDGDLALPTP